MKWVLEYSEQQGCYHIQTLERRNENPINGYRLIEGFDSEEDAFKYMMEHKKRRKK